MKYLILLLVFAYMPPLSAAPEWVAGFGKSQKYPENNYISGFGMSVITDKIATNDCLEFAVNNARADLSNKLRVRVNASLVSIEEETKQQYSAYLSQSIKTSSSITLEGVDIERFIDDSRKTCYALAVVERSKLIDTSRKKLEGVMSEVQKLISLAKGAESDKEKALAFYSETLPLFTVIDESLAIITAVSGTGVKQLLEAEKMLVPNRVEVKSAIEKLLNLPVKNLSDTAFIISRMITPKNISGTVLLSPLHYRETKMSSPFSRHFGALLETKLAKTKLQPVKQDAKYVLSGSYWESQETLRILVTLREAKTGKIAASAEKDIALSLITEANIALKPQNFKQAYSDMKAFAADELVGGGMQVEAWLDKGNDAVMLTEGESTKLYIRVNQPAYIRVIYHLADGSRALLENNYFIDQSKVNKVYELPQEFEVAAPFGSEVLQVFASAAEFPKLAVSEVDGYELITEGLEAALSKTRGLKKKSENKEQINGEKRINITTLPKK